MRLLQKQVSRQLQKRVKGQEAAFWDLRSEKQSQEKYFVRFCKMSVTRRGAYAIKAISKFIKIYCKHICGVKESQKARKICRDLELREKGFMVQIKRKKMQDLVAIEIKWKNGKNTAFREKNFQKLDVFGQDQVRIFSCCD